MFLWNSASSSRPTVSASATASTPSTPSSVYQRMIYVGTTGGEHVTPLWLPCNMIRDLYQGDFGLFLMERSDLWDHSVFVLESLPLLGVTKFSLSSKGLHPLSSVFEDYLSAEMLHCTTQTTTTTTQTPVASSPSSVLSGSSPPSSQVTKQARLTPPEKTQRRIHNTYSFVRSSPPDDTRRHGSSTGLPADPARAELSSVIPVSFTCQHRTLAIMLAELATATAHEGDEGVRLCKLAKCFVQTYWQRSPHARSQARKCSLVNEIPLEHLICFVEMDMEMFQKFMDQGVSYQTPASIQRAKSASVGPYEDVLVTESSPFDEWTLDKQRRMVKTLFGVLDIEWVDFSDCDETP